jgi:hypothetical protein
VGDLGLRLVDNIRMGEEQIGMDWICLLQDTDRQQAVVNNVVNCWVQ